MSGHALWSKIKEQRMGEKKQYEQYQCIHCNLFVFDRKLLTYHLLHDCKKWPNVLDDEHIIEYLLAAHFKHITKIVETIEH